MIEVCSLPNMHESGDYDSIEIHGLAVIGEKVDLSLKAEFFGVFLHRQKGGIMCIGKFFHFRDASSFAHVIHEIFGYTVRNYCEQEFLAAA